jgi:hypothetical protein
MIYCTKCGQELPNDANFCLRCGQAVNPAEVLAQKKAAALRLLILFGSTAAIIADGYFIGVLLSSSGKSQDLPWSDPVFLAALISCLVLLVYAITRLFKYGKPA